MDGLTGGDQCCLVNSKVATSILRRWDCFSVIIH